MQIPALVTKCLNYLCDRVCRLIFESNLFASAVDCKETHIKFLDRGADFGSRDSETWGVLVFVHCSEISRECLALLVTDLTRSGRGGGGRAE